MEDDIKELRDQCDKVLKLLNDPHPGLVTWVIAVANNLKKLRELSNRFLGE